MVIFLSLCQFKTNYLNGKENEVCLCLISVLYNVNYAIIIIRELKTNLNGSFKSSDTSEVTRQTVKMLTINQSYIFTKAVFLKAEGP